MATISEITEALDELNTVGEPAGINYGLVRAPIDASWALHRNGDVAIYLGVSKAEALRSLHAFTDGLRVGMFQAHPVLA